MHKKITAKKSLLFFISVVDMNGRGRRTRTLTNGFGDRCATIDTIPLYLRLPFWWGITDSNRGPTGYEPVALTN